MYDDKFLQFLLKNLLIYGSKTIKDVAQGKKTNNELKLIKVLLDILQEKYTENASGIFNIKIIKKNLTSKPGSKNLVKHIYLLIMAENISLEELHKEEKNIITMINKLRKTSKFFPTKKHLIKKVQQIGEIKKHYSSKSDAGVDTISSKLESLMKKFSSKTELDFETANLILDGWSKEIIYRNKINSDISSIVSAQLQKFLTELSPKCKVMLENESSSQDNPEANENIKRIIYKMNILASLLEGNKEQETINECLALFRKLRYKYQSDEEKFKKREQMRLDKAYSFESLKKTLKIYVDALRYANEMLELYGDGKYRKIEENALKEYDDMIKSNNPRLLDRKFYGKVLDDIKKTTKKAISGIKISKKMSTKDKILNAIANVFNS